MSTLKKILSLSLALAMLMSVSVFAGFADAAEIDKDAAAAVELLTAVKILNGIEKEDGTFDFAPTATIKRAEAAKMIYVLRNGGVDDKAETWKAAVSFADCEGHWAAGYIAYCETYGIINGRTETVFDPEAPVTGIELAKMLLTVAGYKGDVEGYTGNGWEKNVVADANEAGLFDGAKFALTEAAPRQWAAVMFENAFDAQIPVYIGDYRIDGIAGTNQTVAEKFLDFEQETAVVLSTKTATVDGSYASAAGKVELDYAAEGKANAEVTFAVADALVGQQVKITYINDTIVTIAATGKTIAGELKVTAHTGTDAGKYTVKVGGTTILDKKVPTANICGDLTAAAVAAEQAKKGVRVAYTAYDVNGDKAVDYVTTVTTTYGEVKDIVASGDNKGDFKVGTYPVDVSASNVTVNGTMKAGIIAKYTVDTLTGKVVVAPADVVVGDFTGISGTKYTVGGTQYEYATDALESAYLAPANLKDTAVLYTDGKYVVLAKEFVADTDEPTAPTELPSKLAYLIDAKEIPVTTITTDAWGTTTTTTTNVLKVEVLLNDGSKVVLPYENSTSTSVVKDADLSATELKAAIDAFKGGIFEYAITANGKILFKEAFKAIENINFYATSGKITGDLTANGAMGLSKLFNATTKLFGDQLIIGTENTVVFAKYLNDKDEDSTKWTTEYKVIKLADLAGYNVTSTKVVAAKNGTISEALLVIAEYDYKAPTTTVVTTTPYVLATSPIEYVVEGDKIYKTFKAIDLNNAGAAITYKAAANTELTITAGTIYNLTTADGLVTVAAADEWNEGSIQAKVSDLLLIDGAIVETTGSNKGFADNCKIIVKSGDTYSMGTIASLVVAKEKTGGYENNILYADKTGTPAKFTYIIIDLDGKID